MEQALRLLSGSQRRIAAGRIRAANSRGDREAVASPLLADYEAILRCARPLIDVRSPVEFARGQIPGAVNLPLLADAERDAVGKEYKARGRDAAVALGHRLVGGDVKASRVAAWHDFAVAHPEAVITCWRGGLRSEIAQTWLAEAGVELPRVAGGVKALRRFGLDVIEESGARRRFVLVGGRTGTGKTLVVRNAHANVDLEALANHRGSAFGAFPTPQPPPVTFENALAVALLRLPAAEPIVVEDESRTIGRLALPEPLYEAMGRAPIALLDVEYPQRVDNIYREYVLDAVEPAEHLPIRLARIEPRLGGVRYREVAELMRSAFESGDADQRAAHHRWIERLLRYYYDPMYDYQLESKMDRVVVRGGVDEVAAYLGDLA